MALSTHQIRVSKELEKVGVTAYGRSKMSSRHLPRIIHDDEHIFGCVYGRGARGLAMLVATNKRIIFLDRKPLYTSTDELTYDVVGGVRRDAQGLFTSVELHTRIGNYLLRYVNPACARIFVEYIEKRVEHLSSINKNNGMNSYQQSSQIKFSSAVRDFLSKHELAVLSTANRTGELHSAVVNYLLDRDDCLYVLTKAETHKAHNILGHHQVAMTIYDINDLKTVQLQGVAVIETNSDQKGRVFKEMNRPRVYGSNTVMPPVTRLHDGGYITFKIMPTFAKLSSFKPDETTFRNT